MGKKRCDSLSDMQSLGADLYIRCVGCGNRGVFEIGYAHSLFFKRRWNDALEVAGWRFRCSRCGRKGAVLVPGSRSERAKREWLDGAR